jgi:serine protease Do
VGDILTSVDGQPAENVPTVSYNFLLRDSGENVHVEVLRGTQKMAFEVPVQEEKHDIDSILALATPDQNLVPEIGILGVEIDKRIAPMVPDLRHQYGIIVAARTSGAARDVPVLPGDVIVAMNDVPTMTLDYLRTALKRLGQADPVVLQVEREGRLMFLTFDY